MMSIKPCKSGDIPIGRTLCDIKDGEVLEINFSGVWPTCEAVEFFVPFGVVKSMVDKVKQNGSTQKF